MNCEKCGEKPNSFLGLNEQEWKEFKEKGEYVCSDCICEEMEE
jgi:hypothetical protein